MAGLGKSFVLVNPNAANGSAGRQWPRVKKILQGEIGPFDFVLTREPGEATERVREALSRGTDTVLSYGGDGTHNEVVNGFFHGHKKVSPGARLGVLAHGTGSDLVKTLKIPRSTEEAVRVIMEGAMRRLDVGRLTLMDPSGNRVHRYFLNIASFGMGGAVDDKVNRTTKVFGGFASFLWATLSTWFGYRNQEVHLQGGEGQTWSGHVVNVAVANGQYFGGGMHIAPRAKMDDGYFDVVVLGNLNKAEAIAIGPKIYRGTHLDHPKVYSFRTKSLGADSSEKVLLDVDGEQPGSLPSHFEIVPGTLPVILP